MTDTFQSETEQPSRRRGSRTRYDRSERQIIFIALGAIITVALGLVTLLIVTDQLAKNPSRAYNVVPRNLDLWSVYPDGKVRFTTLFYPNDAVITSPDAPAGEETVESAGPLVGVESDVVSTDVIGGTEVETRIQPGPNQDQALVYPLVTLTRTQNGDPYGVDVMAESSPYITDASAAALDVQPAAGTKILALGIGESQAFSQVVVAVAFPKATTVEVQGGDGNVPFYRKVNIGGWVVYYFDTTLVSSTDAIRIHFVSRGSSPDEIDYTTVDKRR